MEPRREATVAGQIASLRIVPSNHGSPWLEATVLRGEITRHRISGAIRSGDDPAAVADALARDPQFLSQTDTLTDQVQEPCDLDARLRRWG